MSRDPARDWIETELLWFRKQSGTFDARLAAAKDLVQWLGGGNVSHVRRELERIRREHGTDPSSDIAAYFYTAGYRTAGEDLNQRLKAYKERHHVAERTGLRRSDRGARAIAQLLRAGLKYDRPWAHLVARQDGNNLKVYLALVLREGSWFAPPAVRINGEPLEFNPEVTELGDNTRYTQFLPDMSLDTAADEDTPLAQVSLAWVPYVTPSWELVANMADSRLYARLSVEPFPLVTLSIRWWDEAAARSGSKQLLATHNRADDPA